jgi:hypothetical protein
MTKELDLAALVKEARIFFDGEPATFEALRAFLLKRFPKVNERAMGYAVRTHLPLVQLPTETDPWSFPGSASFAVAESWLGAKLKDEAPLDALVLRYLAAFGPATPADFQAWSACGGIAPVFERLAAKLATFQDERGRTLYDLPKAPRPAGNADVPVRFVPDYDNLVLGHADRTRIISEAHRPRLVTKNLQVKATFLVDGFVAGSWKVERTKATATLVVEPFEKLDRASKDALAAEGDALLRFVEPDAAKQDLKVL